MKKLKPYQLFYADKEKEGITVEDIEKLIEKVVETKEIENKIEELIKNIEDLEGKEEKNESKNKNFYYRTYKIGRYEYYASFGFVKKAVHKFISLGHTLEEIVIGRVAKTMLKWVKALISSKNIEIINKQLKEIEKNKQKILNNVKEKVWALLKTIKISKLFQESLGVSEEKAKDIILDTVFLSFSFIFALATGIGGLYYLFSSFASGQGLGLSFMVSLTKNLEKKMMSAIVAKIGALTGATIFYKIILLIVMVFLLMEIIAFICKNTDICHHANHDGEKHHSRYFAHNMFEDFDEALSSLAKDFKDLETEIAEVLHDVEKVGGLPIEEVEKEME